MDIHHRGVAVAFVAVVLAVAGCGGDGGGDAAPVTTVPDAGNVVGTEIDTSSAVIVESVADPGPGRTLQVFVNAARAKNLRGMWDVMSASSRERAGPTFAEFTERAGPDFVETVGGFTDEFEVSMSVRTSAVTGVAAVDGRFADPFTGVRGFEAFAAGAVKEKGRWLLEVLPAGALQLISPDTQVASERPVVVVTAEASAPIIDVGIWIDGKQYHSPSDGGSPTRLNVLAQPQERIGLGPHTLVAYAGVSGTTGGIMPMAGAWTFTSA